MVWDTVVAGDSTVEYGTTPDLGLLASASGPSTRHAVQLAGLQPGTTYYYQISANGDILAADTFRTSVSPGSTRFSFAVFGDSGTGNENQMKLAQVMTASSPDLMLHTGDVIYPNGAREDYDAKFFSPYGEIIASVCIFPVAGNHDYMTDDGEPYFDVFYLPSNNPSGTERYYSFDYGDVHFVALDSNIESNKATFKGQEAAEMKEWLISDLDATEMRWKVVYLHNPPYSSGSKHGSYLAVREEFSEIFERFNVDVVFSGDDHSYERTAPIREFVGNSNGVVYVVTGGAGANIRSVGVSDFTAYSARRHHFVLVKVTKNKMTFEAIDLGGTVFDKYVINRNEREAPYSLGVRGDTPVEFLVCASDLVDISGCDFVADGVDDHLDIKRAISWCPQVGCTINLSDGTFNNTAFDKSDRIIVPSNTRIVFKEGTRLDFNGAAFPADRYVFDIDGMNGRVENVYIGGPGLITVNREMDHGLRVKGDARNIFIGDGLRIEHVNPDISDDEGIQITGSIEVSDLIIRDVTITGFGLEGEGAQAIELAGFVRNSLIEGFTSVANRHALALRGVSDPANGVVEADASAGLVTLLEAS
ncbi:MAG: metallophosphoesterase family protein, partial [Chloroflexi bacterium]|nr:metallophosphoesterase family protein [Chloroflexota bacterium]